MAHSTRSGPRVSVATQATKAESAPPLKATITFPIERKLERNASRSPAGPGRGRWRQLRHSRTAVAITVSTGATMPVTKVPNSANRAEPSSNRMEYTQSFRSSGRTPNRVTPHSQSSMPVDPVISCRIRPAKVRPTAPWANIRAFRSSNGRENQLEPSASPRRLDIG